MLGLGLTKYIPLMLYILFWSACIFSIFLRPLYGYFFLLALIPNQILIDRMERYPYGKDIFDILYIAIILGIVLRRNSNGKRESIRESSDEEETSKSEKNILDKKIWLLIPITYSGLWVGCIKFGLPYPIGMENPQFVMWKNFIMLPLLYYLSLKSIFGDNARNNIRLAVAIMLTTIFLISWKYYNDIKYLDLSHYSDEKRNIGNTFSYLGPNEFAAFHAQMAVLSLGIAICLEKGWPKFFAYLVSFLELYPILFLFSRGGYFAVLLGYTFLGILKKRLILVLVLMVVVFYRFFLPDAVVERIEMTKSEDNVDPSVLSRIKLWKSALMEIKHNPITGTGFGTTRLLGFRTSRENTRNDIHNGFLEILLEQGIIGLGLFLYIFFLAIKVGVKLFLSSADPFFRGLGLGFVAMTIAALAANIFGDRWSYLNVMGYWWATLGLVSGAYKTKM
jgi:O-antigen ligase